MRELSIDIETFSSVDLKKSGVYKYVESEDFEIMLLAYKYDDGPTQILDLAELETSQVRTDILDPAITKTAYNAQFEITCLKKYFCPNLDPAQWRCTMVEAAMLGLPLGLGQVADVLKLPVQKYNGFAMIKYFCCPVKPSAGNNMRTRNKYYDDPAKWNEFKEYCKIDVDVEYAIKQKIKFFQVCNFEKPVYKLDQVINSLGVLIDNKLVENCIRISTEYTSKLKQEAIEITGLKNPNSVKQLGEWLSEEMEEEITDLKKATIPKLLAKTDSAIVKRILNIRQRTSKGSVKKYQAMLNTQCADGRIRGLFQYYGANRTGRFAGRGVQVQNLPRNYMKDLDLARQLVLDGDIDQLEMFYGSRLMKVISQLLRTAFIPAPGKTFKISDFSAIEARVISWLAGEKWKLDVFNTHGKIYEATGARMFGVALEDIKKGSSERDAAKISELALGFQGGVGALTNMIESEKARAYEQGKPWSFNPTDEEKQTFVDRWRAANPKIKQYWNETNSAAITAVMEPGGTVKCGFVTYYVLKNVLFCTLPSGRQLSYMRPRIVEGKFGGPQIEYEGMNQTTKKWEHMRAYGGLLVENCLAANTKVLSVQGIINIVDVTNETILWDGFEWVKCNGITFNGTKQTIEVSGVRMTPNHKILTNEGWQNASQSNRFKRSNFWIPESFGVHGIRREKIKVVNSMRLRKKKNTHSLRTTTEPGKILRLQTFRDGGRCSENARDVKTSRILGLEINDRSLQIANASSLEKLRGAGHNCLQTLAQVSKLLGRHGRNLSVWFNTRTKKSKRELQFKELSLGNNVATNAQQKEQCQNRHEVGFANDSRAIEKNRDRENNYLLSYVKGSDYAGFDTKAGYNEKVYDIVNCGPRNQFVVIGPDGPFIVHNCVQAIARDLLVAKIKDFYALGADMPLHIHDEIVIEDDNMFTMDEINEVMGRPVKWAPGLPLRGDGFETNYYLKGD